MDKKQWFQLAGYLIPIVLAQIPKAAPIADEVSAAVAEAEDFFDGPGHGQEKLSHVVNAAKEAAQAVDELRGSKDEVAGVVRDVVDSAVPLINTIVKHTTKK